jgi:hypothetical protein
MFNVAHSGNEALGAGGDDDRAGRRVKSGIGIEAAASGAPCDMPVLLVLLDPVREFVLLRVIPGS